MDRLGLLTAPRRFSALLLAGACLLLPTACRQAPPVPRGVDENPPVEDITEETFETAPETARVLLQTDWVTATEVVLPPGERVTFHRDGDRVAYAHNSHSLRFEPSSGSSGSATTRSFRAGQAARHPSGSLTVENAGESEARFVVVNRSSQPFPPGIGSGSGLAAADGARELLREGSGLAVHALTVESGGTLSTTNGPLQVLHGLGPGTLRVAGDNSLTGAGTFGPGQAATLAGRSSVSNPGGQPAHVLVFTFAP